MCTILAKRGILYIQRQAGRPGQLKHNTSAGVFASTAAVQGCTKAGGCPFVVSNWTIYERSYTIWLKN